MFMICLSSGANLRPKPESHAGGNQGRANADQETERASAFHPRAAQGNRRSALLRRDEGRARSALQVRHPSPRHGARGARLHPPAAESRPGARSAETAGILDAAEPARRQVLAKRHRGQSRPRAPDAGTPISAIQNRSHTISIPPEFLASGDHFALEVKGDSMIEAGILEGDTIVVKKQDSAD